LIVHPRAVVKLLATMMRKVYVEALGLSDDHLDRVGLPFQRRILGGSPAQFMRDATDRPEEFPEAIGALRIAGGCGLLIVAVPACLLVLLLTGAPV
jgi:hypothetical protein